MFLNMLLFMSLFLYVCTCLLLSGKLSEPDDVIVFTDDSVQREPLTKSGWGLFARKDGKSQKNMVQCQSSLQVSCFPFFLEFEEILEFPRIRGKSATIRGKTSRKKDSFFKEKKYF